MIQVKKSKIKRIKTRKVSVKTAKSVKNVIKPLVAKMESNMDTIEATPGTSTNEVSLNSNPTSGIERYLTIVKRKRSPNSTILPTNPQSKVTKTNEFHNRFAELSTDDKGTDNIEDTLAVPKHRPPPIYLREVSSNGLINKLKNCVGENFYLADLKRGRISETKIQASEEKYYCAIVNLLEKDNKNFYTYQLKSAKGLKIILKGIDSNVNTEDIKNDLESQGFKVKIVSKVLNKQKVPQPMFKVELTPEGSKVPKGKIHPIYDVRYVLHRKIIVEEPYKSNSLTQCQNCQEYGHTRTYCRLNSVCVACGENHSTSKCPHNKKDTMVKKCSNCNGNHTACYKGCPVYQYIAHAQNQNKRSRHHNIVNGQQNQQEMQIRIPPSQILNQSKVQTYADVIKNQHPEQQQNNTQNNQDNLTQILMILVNNMQQLTTTIQEMQKSLAAQNALLIKLSTS